MKEYCYYLEYGWGNNSDGNEPDVAVWLMTLSLDKPLN
jgi:hypothetical protein